MGVSRDTFYRYRELADEGGVDVLINRSRRAPNLKNRIDDATERAVVDYAVEFPAHGQHRTSSRVMLFSLGKMPMSLHLFVQPLQRIRRVDFHPVRLREVEVRQREIIWRL